MSGLNALSVVLWEDFCSTIPTFAAYEDKKILRIIKVLGSLIAILILVVASLVGFIEGIIECSMIMVSATSGQLVGCFFLAMLVPGANWMGTCFGMVVSLIIILWMTIGNIVIRENDSFLPTSVEGCANGTIISDIRMGNASDTIDLLYHT